MKARISILLAGVAGVCLCGVAAAVDLRINEFMAVNVTTLQDEDGDYSDWIEIVNADTVTVNLAGWHLTDSAGDPEQWTFPSKTLAPDEHLVVFASAKDRTNAASELHTNFKLTGNGEYLGLVEPDGTTVAFAYAPAYPQQLTDVSYGIEQVVATNTLLTTQSLCRALVPPDDSLALTWTERLGFDDSGWIEGTNGVGYERSTGYEGLINTDIESEMYNVNGSVYIRLSFTVPQPTLYESLTLRMKYDDGFAAYLNGQDLAEAYAPDPPAWNSLATNQNGDGNAVIFQDFHVPNARNFLEIGTNVLAVHGLNASIGSSDALFLLELKAEEEQHGATNSFRYFYLPTPGQPNVGGANDLGPVINSVGHTPAVPTAAEALTVTAGVVDASETVTSVVLYARAMFGAETAIPMHDDGAHGDGGAGDGIYGASIPAGFAGAGEMIRYTITAQDASGDTSRQPLFPDPDATPEYYGTIVNDPSITSALPVLHWFVENASAADQSGGTRCSLFYRGEFYDNVFVRRRGGSSSGLPKKSHKFDFNPGHHFLYHTNFNRVEEINKNTTFSDKTYFRQLLCWETFRDTGDPACDASLVRVQQNASFHGVDNWIEQVDTDYLSRHGLDPKGAMYKMFNNLNNANNVEKKTRKDEDHSDLQDLVDGINSSDPDRFDYLFDNVNLASVVNYIAGNTIVNDRDYGNKNHYLYRDTEGDREWQFFQWDKDLTLGKNWGGSGTGLWHNVINPYNGIYGATWNKLVDAIRDEPLSREMYLRRLRTLMDRFMNEPATPYGNRYYEQRIDELLSAHGGDLQEDYEKWGDPWSYGDDWDPWAANGIATKTNYLEARRLFLFVTNHVAQGGDIPDAQVAHPSLSIGALEFTPANGNQDEEYIQLVNTNAFSVDITGWHLSNAVTHTFAPGTVIGASNVMYVSPDAYVFRNRTASPKGGERLFVQGAYKGHLSARGETIDLLDATGGVVTSLSYTGAPSAFQTDLRVTEIMYHPKPGSTNFSEGDYEFIELKNTGATPLDLTGVRFTEGIAFTFTNTILSPGQYTVLLRDPAAFTNRYDTNGVHVSGTFQASLANDGETLKLEDPLNETILEFDYSDAWYPVTDGDGFALTINDEAAAHDTWGQSNSWHAGTVFHGTPGWGESPLAAGSVVINEILTHTDATQDWVEIHNTTTNPIPLGGWLLSDEPTDLGRYRITNTMILPAGGYLVLNEDDFNNAGNPQSVTPFALSELGESVHLASGSNGTPTGYRVFREFGASDREVTFGRYVNSVGSEHFVALSSATPGASNAPPRLGEVVISEIMYHPETGGDEFIELFNTRTTNQPLYDPAHPTQTWRLTGGIAFTFPTNQVLTARRRTLVVATNDPYGFRLKYLVPPEVAIFGPYTGALENAGETINLRKPGDPEPDLVPYILVDSVAYDDIPPWPTNADGGGPALEKIDVDAYGNDPVNWRTVNVIGSPGTSSQVDGDGDGMPDNWEEIQYGSAGHLLGGALDDYDGDGVFNLWEYRQGTRAGDGTNFFRVRIVLSNGHALVTFPTLAAEGPGYYGLERTYDIQASDGLNPAGWTNIPGHTNLPAGGAWTSYTNQSALPECFFRVNTRLQ